MNRRNEKKNRKGKEKAGRQAEITTVQKRRRGNTLMGRQAV